MTSAILASVVCITVAVAILLRRPRRTLYTYFSAFTIGLSLWHAASLASRLSGWALTRWQAAAALLIPPLALLFFRELLRARSTAGSRFNRAAFGASSLLLLVNFSAWGDSLWARVPIIVYVVASLALGLRGLLRHTRLAPSETDRKRLSYLFYGGLAALILACGELVPSTAVPAAMGHVAVTFYVYFLYQSIVARRLIDLVELLGKGAVVAVLTLVLATVYSLLVLWVGSDQQGLWLFNTLVASFVILILYDQVRPWVEETTAKLLFRERYELRQVVRRLLRDLRTTIGIDEMGEKTLEALHSTGRASQVAMYLAAEGEFAFELLGHRGSELPGSLTLAQQPTLLQELRRECRPILLENLAQRYEDLPTMLTSGDPTLQRELERTSEAIATLRSLHASVVIPMLVQDRIMGVLTLGVDRMAEAYSADELTSLLSLAEACAVVIENSHEYEKRRERDRLVAIGEMATGMAHEIRNPLGAIKGAAQCLEPSTLPQQTHEFVGIIQEEVDRLAGVVEQFLEYARPWRGDPTPTDVNTVVSSTLRLLSRDRIPDEVQVIADLALDLPVVSVDPEQLKQVLINLILNGIQAMPDGGSLTVKTELSRSGRASSPVATEADTHARRQVLVRVTDEGHGILAEDLPRIFVPFFTTKAKGTGLGLPISERIIENTGGRIDVTSHQNKGTTFTVRLPVEAPPTRGSPKEKDRDGDKAGNGKGKSADPPTIH